MFCPKCGKNLSDDERFCTECGTPLLNPEFDSAVTSSQISNNAQMPSAPMPQVPSAPMQPAPYYQPMGFTQPSFIYNTYINKMDSSASAWMVVAILQIIFGVVTLIVGVGIVLILMGIWNISQSNKLRNNVNYFRRTPAGIVEYVDSSGSGILCLIINIFIGGLPGIIGAAIDMSTKSYGKNNRQALWAVEFGGGMG
ncbi:MAG: zinc ribbon domain-containing protein [Butyrivibrio sp.]|nr:zinc ribbon domain-containing protein [Butyrivibrio sp.]